MELLPTQEPDLGEAEQSRDYLQTPKAGAVLHFPTLDLIPLVNTAHIKL